jgi:hypothetical protein
MNRMPNVCGKQNAGTDREAIQAYQPLAGGTIRSPEEV